MLERSRYRVGAEQFLLAHFINVFLPTHMNNDLVPVTKCVEAYEWAGSPICQISMCSDAAVACMSGVSRSIEISGIACQPGEIPILRPERHTHNVHIHTQIGYLKPQI